MQCTQEALLEVIELEGYIVDRLVVNSRDSSIVV